MYAIGHTIGDTGLSAVAPFIGYVVQLVKTPGYAADCYWQCSSAGYSTTTDCIAPLQCRYICSVQNTILIITVNSSS